jgi:hypothetical protein
MVTEIVRLLKDRPKRYGRMHLTNYDRLFILYQRSQHMSVEEIAKRVPCGYSSVRQYLEKVRHDPSLLFAVNEVYIETAPNRFSCGFCRAVKQREAAIQHHVLGHIFPIEVSRDYSTARIKARRY